MSNPIVRTWLLLPVLVLVGCPDAPHERTAYERAPQLVDGEGPTAALDGGLSGALTSDDASYVFVGTDRNVFGMAVADAGDVNGDGYADLIAGDVQAGRDGTDPRGAARLFLGPVSGYGFADSTASLTLVGGEDGDAVGWSVAGAGDLDGDGLDDLLVGAIRNDDAAADAGAVYVVLGGYEPYGVVALVSEATGTLEGEQAGDQLGRTLAPVGDLDGDESAELVVSTPRYDGERGSVYVFGSVPRGTLSAGQASVQIIGAASGEGFGTSYAGCDANGDGVDDLWVSAFGGGDDAEGALHLFEGDVSASSSSDADLTITGASPGDRLGYRVACAADFDGDGRDDVLVSAPGHDGGSGGAFVFHGGGSGAADTDSADVLLLPDTPGEAWGLEPAVLGDVDGDGWPDLALGSQLVDDGDGVVHVFSGVAGGTLGPDDAIASFSDPNLARVGRAVSGLDDIDGDGQPEVVVSAASSVPGEESLGILFVLQD